MLAVNAPRTETTILVDSMLTFAPMVDGVDGPWLTSTSNKVVLIEGQSCNIVATEVFIPAAGSQSSTVADSLASSSLQLAWQLLPSSSPSTVSIAYRVSVFFEANGATYISPTALSTLERGFRVSLSRRIAFTKSGRNPKKNKEEHMPALVVAFVEKSKEEGRLMMEELTGAPVWRYAGVIEVPSHESKKSLVTCNASVR